MAASHRHPAWFGAVMGTGALALALGAQSTTLSWPWLETAGFVMLIVASLLAVVLLPRYARRLTNRDELATEVSHPAMGPMLATLPAGLLVLAAAWGRVGSAALPSGVGLWVDALLLIIGTLLALTLGLAWSATMLQSAPPLEAVNGGWLIPPVMNLLVPVALAPLIVANPGAAPLLLLIGFAFYGIGAILFMALLTLLIARLALRPPVPAQLAASMWIPLAPAGVLGLSLIRLLQSAEQAGVAGYPAPSVGVLVAAMGIGFGLWWSAFAALELRRIRREGPVPVHPGWWGFVFPVAAMALSITAVGSATSIAAIEVVGVVATVVLIVTWLVVAARTLRMLKG